MNFHKVGVYLRERTKSLKTTYLDFQMCTGAEVFAEESSVPDPIDLEISSTSDTGKFRMNDETNGSVAAVETLALFDLYAPVLPSNTCK